MSTKENPQFIEISPGIYADPVAENMMLVNPIEVLRDKGLPLDQQSAFSVYQLLLKQAQADKMELVLINDDSEVTSIETVTEDMPEREDEPEPKPSTWDGVERRRFPRS